jgi:hypothetical protein
VLRLARAGEKEVVLNAPEGQLARFKPGQDVAITLWADPSNPFRGRVREVAGGADPVTRTYAVRVSALDAPCGRAARHDGERAFQYGPSMDSSCCCRSRRWRATAPNPPCGSSIPRRARCG